MKRLYIREAGQLRSGLLMWDWLWIGFFWILLKSCPLPESSPKHVFKELSMSGSPSRLWIERILDLASYRADHLSQSGVTVAVVADLKNFTVGALKGLPLGNSGEFDPSGFHTLWQLLHAWPLSTWKGWLTQEDKNCLVTRYHASH